MAAVVAINAANIAYRKAIRQTRDKDYLSRNYPVWMSHFAERLPEKDENSRILDIQATPMHKRARTTTPGGGDPTTQPTRHNSMHNITFPNQLPVDEVCARYP